MAGATVRIPVRCPNSDEMVKYSGRPEDFAFLIFGFLDEGEGSSESSCSSGEITDYGSVDDMDVEEDCNGSNVEEDKAFWESKEQLLQATLRKTSSIETKIRRATREALTESKLASADCTCRRPVAADGCRNCLRREISDRLQVAGYNCAICKSKWRSSPDILSGEHTYLEVVDNSSAEKGELRVIIELNFKAEFEMARANDEYNRLISRLPEVVVSKAPRLRALIKILCSASKKCTKDKNMHMGPWRKQKYMQAKWFGTCERTMSVSIRPEGFSGRLPKPIASLLTFELVEDFPVLHRTAVQVV